MGKFKIDEPGKHTKWVKRIDKVNETLEFTENESEAYYRDGGFYTKSELDFIKFHFKKKYPEVAFMRATGGDW